MAANVVFRKLKGAGYDVYPVNPNASELEGAPCYRDVASIPGPLDGVVIATAPRVSADIVRQCAARGVRQVWLHRSFGAGSVADEAVRECAARQISCIVGGCPVMFVQPVDLGHRCMRWWLQHQHRVPR
jgi:predicted CoA-binding protein